MTRPTPEYSVTADTSPPLMDNGRGITFPTVFSVLPAGTETGSAPAPVIRYFRDPARHPASPLDKQISKILKRIFDITAAVFVLLLIFPWLIPIVAILIRLDSRGPVFFLQKRNGRKGRLFTCLKFRSMTVNPQADLIPATPRDERITRFGRFLRTYHIDEFPQFLNVLSGDMSVIGPRPHMVRDNLLYESRISQYALRHEVKPGITGLAQVMGYTGGITCPEKMKSRVEADLFYIWNWSFFMDLHILFLTFRSFFTAGRFLHKQPGIAWRSNLHHAAPPISTHFGGAA